MKSMEGIIKPILEANLSNSKYSIFASENKLFQFECVYSAIKDYQSNKTYSPYELPSLERILIKKADIINSDILLPTQQQERMSLIINWERELKLVITLEVPNYNSNQHAQSIVATADALKKKALDLLKAYSFREI